MRDRSSAPGCDGCIRITAGVVGRHAGLLAALEEVLCAARTIDRDTPKRRSTSASASTAAAATTCRTGIRFLDHMLELFARHGGFDLR